MDRRFVLVLMLCASQVYPTKGRNKTVQDVLDHFNPIVSELALQVQNLGKYYRNETGTEVKQTLRIFPEDLQQKSSVREKLLQSEVLLLKAEAAAVENYNEIYQKCRPQINKELDALNMENEQQNIVCQNYMKEIEVYVNNTELSKELKYLETEIDNITTQCAKCDKSGQVRKCFHNKINIIRPQLKKLKEGVKKRIEVIKDQFPTVSRPYLECSYNLHDDIVIGIREITIRNLRKCVQNQI